MQLQFDREALKKALATRAIRPPGEDQWCIACGAGANAVKPDGLDTLLQEKGQQFLDPKVVMDFVTTINERLGGLNAWCIACGASKGFSPGDIVLPADVSDAYIDELAQRLIGTVKLG